MRRIVQALAKMPSFPILKAAQLGDKARDDWPRIPRQPGLDSQIPRAPWRESQVSSCLPFGIRPESHCQGGSQDWSQPASTSLSALTPPALAAGWGGGRLGPVFPSTYSIILRGRVTPVAASQCAGKKSSSLTRKPLSRLGPGACALCTVTLPQCQPHKHVTACRGRPPPSKGLVLTLQGLLPASGNQTAACRPH